MSTTRQWLPRSIECLEGYGPRQFWHDLIAGLTVGLVALPLAMAFAIASGVSPQAGLYTAVVAGFVISALGGLAHPDWRADGRVCGDRRGHCGEVRAGWPGAGESDGGRRAGGNGPDRAGFGGEVYSTGRHHRVHQRDRGADCIDPDQRFLRAEDPGRTERISAAHGDADPLRRDHPVAGDCGVGGFAGA